MSSLRFHLSVTAGILAAILLLAAIGDALQQRGIVTGGTGIELAAKVLFSGLTLALFLSAVPLIVTVVLRAQLRFHGERPLVRTLAANERLIVLVFWTAGLLGVAVALAAAIRTGAFETGG